MKDKIYLVRPYSASEQELPFISEDELPGYLNTVYISKDALIEWLENKINVSDVSFIIINGQTYLAYKDVIEYLNEM